MNTILFIKHMSDFLKKLNIPFIKQEADHFCGPACLQMVFSYLDVFVEQKELARRVETSNKTGTENRKMIDVVKEYGFNYFTKYNSEFSEIEKYLKDEIPIIVNFVEPSDDEGHYGVVVGVTNDKIIMNDPWNGKDFEMDKEDFIKRWTNHNQEKWGWILVISKASSRGNEFV